MTIMDDDKRHISTFSQREGKAPLSEAMELGTIPQIFRNKAWRCVDLSVKGSFGTWRRSYGSGICEFVQIMRDYRFDILSIPHDEILNLISDDHGVILNSNEISSNDHTFCRNVIVKDEYHKVITFIEYMLRHSKCPKDLYVSLLRAFDETPIAYFVETIEGLPTVLPRISREAGEATRQAIEALQETNMDGAAAHLRQAAEHLNAGQFADSIADSIHAVGSVARLIAPGDSNTLSKALASLEKAGLLKHPALKEAFDKLYGYTSDEQGIRHELLDKSAPDVGRDEAVFMFGACASFAAYLANKHRHMQGGGDG